MTKSSKLSFRFSAFAFVFLFSTDPVFCQSSTEDWLVDNLQRKAEIFQVSATEIQLRNGLIQRTFSIADNVVCYDFTNLMNGSQLLRTIMPEARLTLNGKTYEVGGTLPVKEKGYFKKEWLTEVENPKSNFQYQSFAISEIQPQFPSKTQFWTSAEKPSGGKKTLIFLSAS